MKNEPKLESCPFCGSADLEILSLEVSCKNCNAMGPELKETDQDFVALWNKRVYFSKWTANYGFPHMKEVGWLFKKKVPNGWMDWDSLGETCSSCSRYLHIGIEDGKSFRYCPREMTKTS